MFEQRIIDLEIRYSHQEEYIRQLNEVLVGQQKTIERMEKEIIDLKRIVGEAQGEQWNRDFKDEKPPHY